MWQDTYPTGDLSQHGLSAYAAHPLLRTVCIDRTFYRPLQTAEYAAYAQSVGPDFRFVVKAPALVTDALVRGEDGRGLQPNIRFLDPRHAVDDFVAPALAGLGERCGALVFQLSPLSAHWLHNIDRLLTRLDAMLGALPAVCHVAPDAVIAVEVRDAVLLTPALADVLRRHRATYCVGVHAKLPPLQEQLPMLRALWPGPLVCRWNYHRRHGAFGFDEAEQAYAPFDRLIDPDIDTRHSLARVALATATAGHAAYITVSNKAEGSAPLSVGALAHALQAAAVATSPTADGR